MYLHLTIDSVTSHHLQIIGNDVDNITIFTQQPTRLDLPYIHSRET